MPASLAPSPDPHAPPRVYAAKGVHGRVMEVLEAGRLHEARHPYTRGLLNCLPDLKRPHEVLPVLERDPAWLDA